MSIKPILFSTPMVQAIQRGEKTQTRRVLKVQPNVPDYKIGGTFILNCKDGQYVRFHSPNAQFSIGPGSDVKLPYAVGDRLWVKETWRKLFCAEEEPCLDCQECRQAVAYKADEKFPDNYTSEAGYRRDELWRSSLFMPKWAARIWLEVTGVRVERLQSISDVDVYDEGLRDCFRYCIDGQPWIGIGKADLRRVQAFKTLWDSINAKKHPWESNPWVAVYEFKRADEPLPEGLR